MSETVCSALQAIQGCSIRGEEGGFKPQYIHTQIFKPKKTLKRSIINVLLVWFLFASNLPLRDLNVLNF